MKFIYVDESGDSGQGDVFTMCGLMVDGYNLHKKTTDFDKRLKSFLQKHPGKKPELKTSSFINGKGGWSKVNPQERKDFLTDVCKLAVRNSGKIFGIGLSFSAFNEALKGGFQHPTGKSHWLAAAIFTSCLVQKRMQGESKNKGHTVVIMDDNKCEMSSLSEALYNSDPWFDGLYQNKGKSRGKRGKKVWIPRKSDDRFDQIINTAFAIKSDHSSLIQVADAICYVYRRHLELKTDGEKWPGEKKYYQGLVNLLEPKRQKLGLYPNDELCVQFFKQAKHPDWKL